MRMIIMIGTMSAPNKGTLRMTVHKNVQNRADETQKSNMIKISRGAFVKISERERDNRDASPERRIAPRQEPKAGA